MATYETIRLGSTGASVRELQKRLNARGYGTSVDGSFGPRTKAAVKAYQKNNRLTPDGTVGEQTWGSLSATAAVQGGTAAAPKGGTAASTQGVSTPASTGIVSAKSMDRTGYSPSPEVISAEQELEELEASRPGEYESLYQEELEELYREIMERPAFSYDLETDPLYGQYRRQYEAQGRRAMEDTMGRAAGLTGGYGSSYSQGAGQQAYGSFLQELNARIPELYQLALSRYHAQGDALKEQYDLLYGKEKESYDRWRESNDRWYRDYTNAQGRYDDLAEEDFDRYMDILAYYQRGSSGSSGSSSGSSSSERIWKDIELDVLAGQYIGSGGNGAFGSSSMVAYLEQNGVSPGQYESFYEALRRRNYRPAQGGGGIKNRVDMIN